ncbi:MAG TPA: LLM class flavin-dependent oxidoreductase [Steroidobacteraceae bacterium]
MRWARAPCDDPRAMYLSVIDQSPVPAGSTPADALRNTIELARLADRLGYRRYWIAEHHAMETLASPAPEILIARIGAETRHIRLGSGGVMLPHYSPLKVAETFRMLETLSPGRIDLGIGRAPGSDQWTARALQHGPGALGIEHFPGQIGLLMGFLGDDLPADHPFAGIHAMPTGATVPEVWLLGSSDESAAYAAHFGCAFSFAHFINGEGGVAAMAAYRRDFQPSPRLAAPLGSVGVFVLCAETEEEARVVASSRDLSRLRRERGVLGPVPSVEEALAYPYSDRELAWLEYHRRRQFVGTPAQVRQGLVALAAEYGVEELVILSICHEFAKRVRSYELLAAAFELESIASPRP